MKCQICNNKEANIVFTQIVNNEKLILHICSECAKLKGISIEIEKPFQPKINVFSENNPINNIINEKEEKINENIKCEFCNQTLSEFRKTGLFGCDKCHEAFSGYVANLLKQIHGTDVYKGKIPEEIFEKDNSIQQLKNLQNELKHCVDIEDYERAAVIRDKITAIERKELKK
jgi:protein arginine kinase activator